MTLVLFAFDAAAGTLRWANAGHDPGVLYRLASDEIFPLGAGD